MAVPAIVIQDGVAFKRHLECSDYMQMCAQLRATYGPVSNSEKTRSELNFLKKKYLKSGRAIKVRKGQELNYIEERISAHAPTFIDKSDYAVLEIEGRGFIAFVKINDEKYFIPASMVVKK